MLQLQTSPTFFKTPLNYLILLSNFDYWTISHFGIFNILIYMNYFSRNYSFPTKFCPKLSHISLPFRGGLNFQSTINQQPKTSDCDRARYSNAIKFTSQGTVSIEAREVSRNKDSALLEFAVSDTGLGIPENKLSILFQPFSQADSSTTREYGGTGLGLSIVRSFATLMDGTAGVESALGQGTRFWFQVRVQLVLEKQRAFRATPDSLHEPDSQESTTTFVGTILVVEDNLTNQKVVSVLLDRLGLDVEIAENGAQAVARMTQNTTPPDLVLMDIQMPIMDGYTATRQIRSWEKETGRAPLTIIALTAGAFDEDRKRCFEAGMDDFMAKPVAFEDLKQRLSHWLSSDSRSR